MPPFASQYETILIFVEWISLAIFSLEYALRVWAAPESGMRTHLSIRRARLHYMCSPIGIVDLLAVAPFWLAFLLPTEMRIFLVFRVVRFLKLARYSPGMRSLLDALYHERRALFGCLIILLGTALFAATAMYLVERDIQPQKFGTIPDSLWWAISTLGTIGYGDVVPITGTGKLVASITVIAGLVMIALPVGIIATAFSEEIHRRDFVVTWGMVARVPVFSALSAAQIADVMELLRAQSFEARQTIMRKGEPAEAMYFIAAGTVEIRIDNRKFRLEPGQFFGEISTLRRTHRSGTAHAITPVSLLILQSHDLHALMLREPKIARRIQNIARKRAGGQFARPSIPNIL